MLLLNLLVTLIFPVFLVLYSAAGANQGPDLGIIFTTYIGLFFVGLAYIGFGLFWSSVTESQLIAVVLTFATNFTFWLLSLWAQGGNSFFHQVLKHMAINDQFMTFSKGNLQLDAVVYFLSIIFFALFLTNRSLEAKSWST